MQDSLEDYLQLLKNTKPDVFGKVKKEELITAQVKWQCKTWAQRIVEFLIDGPIRGVALSKCLLYLNPPLYQDVVDERSISSLCGYPLCGNDIPLMPSKQYYIDSKRNEVYDISERKKFCSNICYKASLHIQGQIDDSPLWLRNADDVKQFNFLPLSDRGCPGKLIDYGMVKPDTEPCFTSVAAFTEASLEDVDCREAKVSSSSNSSSKLSPDNKYASRAKTPRVQVLETIREAVSIDKKPIVKSERYRSSAPRKVIPIEPLRMAIPTSIPVQETCSRIPSSAICENLKPCIKRWFTLETLIFVNGIDNVRNKLNSAKLCKYFKALRIEELKLEQQQRYATICRRIQLREQADDDLDRELLQKHLERLPVPDYKELQEQGKVLELKVRSFYDGELYEQADTNFPTHKKVVDSTEKDDDDVSSLVDPLCDVDVQSQIVIRRKVFLTSMRKAMLSLITALELDRNFVMELIQRLVKTFQLEADNVMFRNAEWEFISIVLLKIISLMNEDIRGRLNEQRSTVYLELWAKNGSEIIENILTMLTDVDMFIQTFIE